jgi:cyclopropane-fatty-acyl-phospholipid synthase
LSVVTKAIDLVERAPVPDALIRLGIGFLVGQTSGRLAREAANEAAFAVGMDKFPIAVNVEAANEQHYELPPEFFALVLGPRRKYSCCLYQRDIYNLDNAEEKALLLSCEHADLANGQEVLELGCGWGSLSLWMAAHYPGSRITAVSNSRPQRAYILAAAEQAGLRNLDVITADMNNFVPSQTYDRIVSVEMFEHMANWRALLGRVRTWLKPEGRLFVHVFSHQAAPYRFDHHDPEDWIARYFFTGGIMPSHGLIKRFSDLFTVEQEWIWNGRHYQRTANDWLANFDRNRPAIEPLLRGVYGMAAPIWLRRWRLFFLATAGLFGHAGGREWGVSHYRLRLAG